METNNKLREALEKIANYDYDFVEGSYRYEGQICADIARKALAEPPRNCDVGTVAEQTKRLRANCERFKPTCKGCKCFTDIQEENCWLKWAQMPYEEKKGGNDDANG